MHQPRALGMENQIGSERILSMNHSLVDYPEIPDHLITVLPEDSIRIGHGVERQDPVIEQRQGENEAQQQNSSPAAGEIEEVGQSSLMRLRWFSLGHFFSVDVGG